MKQQKSDILKNSIMVFTQQKKYAAARKAAQKLVKLQPKNLEARFALAQLSEQLNEFQEAVLNYTKASTPPSPVTQQALTKAINICAKHKFNEQGIVCAKALCKLSPNNDESHFALGLFYFNLKEFNKARKSFNKALTLNPNNSKYLTYAGEVEMGQRHHVKALEFREKVHALNPDNPVNWSASVFLYNYLEKDIDGAKMHFKCGELFENKAKLTTHFPEFPPSNRKIRIGYCSENFYDHSVTFFMRPLIEGHNKEKFEIFCYSDAQAQDKISQLIKDHSDHWCDTLLLTDEDLYKTIRNDGIDILVDLMGYSGRCRLCTFAMKAAPIQVNYLGYPNTTGLKRMDYRLIDELTDPVGMTESFHTENLIRLKDSFLCYSPSEYAPEVNTLPALKENKLIRFSSFNALQKITNEMIEVWSKILKAVPNSELFLKAAAFVIESNREEIRSIFNEFGIPSKRLIFDEWTLSKKEHLERYNDIDLHLDTFPYNGTTTTCESLWQGVPTITLAGNNHRSRVSLSILTNVGLSDYITYSKDDYIDKAIKTCQDLNALNTIRLGLRESMIKSPLMDSESFVHKIEHAYGEMIKQAL